MIPHLTTRYLGLQPRNPVIIGASPFSDSLTACAAREAAGASAIVLRSLFAEQFELEQRALVHPTAPPGERFSAATSYFPRCEQYPLGPDLYLRRIKRLKKLLASRSWPRATAANSAPAAPARALDHFAAREVVTRLQRRHPHRGGLHQGHPRRRPRRPGRLRLPPTRPAFLTVLLNGLRTRMTERGSGSVEEFPGALNLQRCPDPPPKSAPTTSASSQAGGGEASGVRGAGAGRPPPGRPPHRLTASASTTARPPRAASRAFSQN